MLEIKKKYLFVVIHWKNGLCAIFSIDISFDKAKIHFNGDVNKFSPDFLLGQNQEIKKRG